VSHHHGHALLQALFGKPRQDADLISTSKIGHEDIRTRTRHGFEQGIDCFIALN
jgi:hypothetical protein